MIRSVLFDLDGTLTDSRDGIVRCIAHALTALGRECPDPAELTRWIGAPLAHCFEALLDTSDETLIREAIRLYRERFVEHGMYENRVYPDIPAGLCTLQGLGLRLWVVTSKPRLLAEQILEHYQLRPYFCAVYGSEPSGERTDKGDIIRAVLESEGIRGCESVMVGDREHDVRAARQNGVRAVAVLWGYGSREELELAPSRRDGLLAG
jgi:phosphoglycolate phosphatase